MELKILRSTPEPDKLVCETARGDYMEEWNGEVGYSEMMSGVEPEREDVKLAGEIEEGDYDTGLQGRDLPATCRLIRKLLEQPIHSGPFEHPSVTFTAKGVSRITMAQLTRHRHVSFDVQSMRYVDFEEPDYIEIPELGNSILGGQYASFKEFIKENRSDEEIEDNRERIYENALDGATEAYHRLLDYGVAPENARAVLPLASKVNISFTMNLRTLMHVADMRAAGDAQWEIRGLTERVLDLAEDVAPVTMKTYQRDLKDRRNRLAP